MDENNLQLYVMGFSDEDRQKIINMAMQFAFDPVELGRAIYAVNDSNRLSAKGRKKRK